MSGVVAVGRYEDTMAGRDMNGEFKRETPVANRPALLVWPVAGCEVQ